jgi:hypothetical protein
LKQLLRGFQPIKPLADCPNEFVKILKNDFIDPHSTRNWRLVALVAFVCRVMVCCKVFRIFS